MIYSDDSVGWPMVRLGCHQSYCTSWDLSVLKFFSKLYISIRTDMWQVPVDAAAKDTVTNHGKYSMPEEARSSTAWMNTLPASSEVAATQCDEEIWAVVCSAAVSRRLVLKRVADFPSSACLGQLGCQQRDFSGLAAEFSAVLCNFNATCWLVDFADQKKHIMAVQKQGTAMYQLSSFRLIACELIMACLFMLRLLRSWCWPMTLREPQPRSHVHTWMNTYTYILIYVRRHAQHEHSISHTYIIHTYIAHTHINSLTHTPHTYIICIKKNSPTIAFPSLSYFLFPCSLARSLTHSHSHSLTCACAYIHTYTKAHPPSPLHHSYTSSSLLAFLCSVYV